MSELKGYLEKIAKKESWQDSIDFNVYDFSGGNYDDAYYGGCDTGEILLARELLAKFFEV
jgi:hypothetical protein